MDIGMQVGLSLRDIDLLESSTGFLSHRPRKIVVAVPYVASSMDLHRSRRDLHWFGWFSSIAR
jgi:hypothetical protein